ncbi:MAG TPA: Rieske 2Fe-2S domain-containing protein [Chitinophagaceae bacterium]|nr:Rieske 2Fe-2S domain-containing protein [Chitinophagaceae bacterium]
MDRRDFIKNSCVACISGTTFVSLLSSCHATKYSSGKLEPNGISVSKEEFIHKKNNKKEYHSYIIVRNEKLQYPICIYRLTENEYTALWMRCTHQGTELQVAGDRLQCPAHGSEFTNHGLVSNGPAAKNLRSFPVTISENKIYLDLRAV